MKLSGSLANSSRQETNSQWLRRRPASIQTFLSLLPSYAIETAATLYNAVYRTQQGPKTA